MKKSQLLIGFAAGAAAVFAAFKFGVVRLKYFPPAGARGYSGPDPWSSASGALKLYSHIADLERQESAKRWGN